MVNPVILCQKHLGGEHVEHHMFIGSFKRKIRIDGYIRNNLIQPTSICDRHDVLASELVRRKYLRENKIITHASPLPKDLYEETSCYLCQEQKTVIVDILSSLNDLLNRCPKCLERHYHISKLGIDAYDSYYQLPYDSSFDFERRC